MKEELNKEQEITIRYQLIFGVAGLCVALAAFWVGSTYNIIDLRFGFLFLCVLMAGKWMLDALLMLSDVFVVIMKIKNIKP